MNVRFFPRDQFGIVPAIEIGSRSFVFGWPHGKMKWFIWEPGCYRIGPITLIEHELRRQKLYEELCRDLVIDKEMGEVRPSNGKETKS